jgi:hypothetical protein
VFAVVKAVSVAATGYATGDSPPGRLPV